MIKAQQYDSLNKLPKHLILVLALYLLGGSRKKINTEKIVHRAFKLRPIDFSWSLKEFKNFPDLDTSRRQLFKARDDDKLVVGAYARDASKDGWRLTELGIKECDKYKYLLNIKKDKSNPQLSDKRELSRIRKHSFYKDYINNQNLDKYDEYLLADLLQVRADNIETMREKFYHFKIVSKIIDSELHEFFNYLANKFSKLLDETKLVNQQKIRNRSKKKLALKL